MKKWKRLLLCLGLVLGLTACGRESGQDNAGQPSPTQGSINTATKSPETPTGNQQETPSETTPSEPGATNPEESAGGKTLVVYYSATSNTETVAGYIAAATGGDLFELVPTESYSSSDLNWSDQNSRVSREHEDSSLRVVELENAVPENWEDYDIVFVGYPIWWGIAAWPVDGFISANDFTGKTVIPFCTSSSSGLGESGELLKEAAGTGNWLEGARFRSRASEEDVKEWVNGLELEYRVSDSKNSGGWFGSVVYFTSDISPEGMMEVYKALGWTPAGNVAVKLSTGEPPASNYLRPELIRDLVQSVDGTIVECNTAYGGSRTETAMHMQVAKDHGFTEIADVDGSAELVVEGGNYLETNYVGSHFMDYDSYVVLSHFKGHAMAGFGGAIKNISIGLGSKEGKCVIHTGGASHTSPWGF